MTYLDEVLHSFVDDISTKLNVDLSWALEQRSEKLLAASMQYQDELQGVLKTQLDSHNLNFQKKLVEIQDTLTKQVGQHLIDVGEKHIPADRILELKQCGIEISDTISTAVDHFDNGRDMVEFFKGNIPSSEILQNESIKNLVQLATQQYLLNNENLIVPLEYFEKAKTFWEQRAALGDIDAQAILKELVAGQISRSLVSIQGTWVETVVVTFADEEKAQENIQKFANLFLIPDPVDYKGQFITHEVIKQTNASLKQAIAYMVGRCVAEIRQAWKDQSIDFSTRLQNIINDTKREFKEVFEQGFKNLSKSVMDYVVGLITSFYKNIHQAIQKGGQHFKIICDEMWAFITGKNKSLFQTVVNISKTIAALAVITLIVGLHQYLASMGVPEAFVIVITAFVSALVTVAIFRLIEKAAQITSSVFYTRDVAKIRRQEVERICEEILPLIEEKVAQLDILIEQEDREREELFNRSFTQIKASLTSIEIDQIVLAYQELYQYLGKDLPFKNEKDFDGFMMDGRDFIL